MSTVTKVTYPSIRTAVNAMQAAAGWFVIQLRDSVNEKNVWIPTDASNETFLRGVLGQDQRFSYQLTKFGTNLAEALSALLPINGTNTVSIGVIDSIPSELLAKCASDAGMDQRMFDWPTDDVVVYVQRRSVTVSRNNVSTVIWQDD